jgi:hypothetical protein
LISWPQADATIVICGDFNEPSTDSDNIDHGSVCFENFSGLFSNFCLSIVLTKFVPHTARVTKTTASSSPSTQDLVMCNELNFVLNTSVGVPFSSGDHSKVDFSLMHRCRNSIVVIASYNFDRADWQGFFTYLLYVTDFDYVFSQCDEDAHGVIVNIISACISQRFKAFEILMLRNFRTGHLRGSMRKKSGRNVRNFGNFIVDH